MIPTENPSFKPSFKPSFTPSILPTNEPSFQPTLQPTYIPTTTPTFAPSSVSISNGGASSNSAGGVGSFMGMDGTYFYAVLIAIILIPVGFAAYCYCYNKRLECDKDNIPNKLNQTADFDNSEPQFANIYPSEKEFELGV